MMYERLKQAKTMEEVKEALNLDQYANMMDKQTYNDLQRFLNELLTKASQMNQEDAVRFVLEAFRYFQISLYTKIENINKGIWG
jgi:vacuolar-type H+-ATPase subunit C/Vma6